MTPCVLFIVTSDPRVSARPAEAIRIAAGLGSGRSLPVQLYLRDAAVLVLGEAADELVDGENFSRYLPLFLDSGQSIFVQAGAPLLAELAGVQTKFEPVDDAWLAQEIASSRYVLRF